MAGERALPALPDPDRVEIGYWLSSEEHTPHALVRHAAAAEGAGFRHALVSDHYAPWSPAQGESGFVWSVLGAIAANTRNLRVGTGVSAAVHRMHPVTLAQAAATVATLMPGRFFLGLGSGERLNEQVMGKRWAPPKERRERLEEAVDVIRKLWSGSPVNHAGKHFRVERAQLFTRPDTPPPIVLAAGGKKAAQLAASIADGMIGVSDDPALVDAFEAAGGVDKPRLGQVHLCWAASEAEARQTVRHWWPNAGLPSALLSELAVPQQFAAATRSLREDDIVQDITCGPDPEVHIAAIKRFVAAGFTTVYLHQIGPEQCGFLQYARKELLPRLRSC
jgi:coenzyme F420-dependent glucose-6-phosphate dehydrogenase